MMLAVVWWGLFSALEMGAVEMGWKIFWNKVLLLGILAAPVCYLLFALAYAGHDEWMRPKRFLWLCATPLLTLIVAFTNPWHHWMWTGYLDSHSPYHIIIYQHGLAYWLGLVGYSYVLFTAGTLVMLQSLSRVSSGYRPQIIAIIVGSLIPFLGSLPYVLSISPIPGLDFTPLCLAIAGILFGYAILRMQLLNMVPMARATLIESMPDGFFVFDHQHRLIDFNSMAQTFTHGRLFVGMSLHDLPDFWKDLRSIMESDNIHQRLEITKPLPTLQTLDARVTQFYSPAKGEKGHLVIVRDISANKETENALRAANERLMELTTRDSLTGLYNRKYMLDTLERELARARREKRPLSLMMIDLDQFKSFNEQHGIQASESMLQGLGILMKRHTRVEDIASRFGEDEFSLLMTGASIENAFKRAEIMRQEFELFGMDWVGSKLVTTVSIGIAAFPDHGENGSEILRAAQDALDLAKISGRNCCVIARAANSL
jgi:diguanylate cyclase (GGDEF)-like protein